MKRFYLLCFFVFFVSFCVFSFYMFPYERVFSFTLKRFSNDFGVKINWVGLVREKTFPSPVVRVIGVKLQGRLLEVFIKNLFFSFSPLDSILNRGVSLKVSCVDGSLSAFLGVKDNIRISVADFVLTFMPGMLIKVSDLDLRGDVSAKGSVIFDPRNPFNPKKADVIISVSKRFRPMFESIARIYRMKKTKEGNWLWKR